MSTLKNSGYLEQGVDQNIAQTVDLPYFHLHKPLEEMRLCPIVKSIPFKANRGKQITFLSDWKLPPKTDFLSSWYDVTCQPTDKQGIGIYNSSRAYPTIPAHLPKGPNQRKVGTFAEGPRENQR